MLAMHTSINDADWHDGAASYFRARSNRARGARAKRLAGRGREC